MKFNLTESEKIPLEFAIFCKFRWVSTKGDSNEIK